MCEGLESCTALICSKVEADAARASYSAHKLGIGKSAARTARIPQSPNVLQDTSALQWSPVGGYPSRLS